MLRKVAMCWVLVCLGVSGEAFAQSDRSVWGFSGSVVPKWKMPSELGMLFDADTADVTGSEFRVGVVRGRPLGGDWGVSFVRKKFKEGSMIAEEPYDACGNTSCVTVQSTASFQNVSVAGIEAYRHFTFATIKERAQIGLTVAGGVGSWKGESRVEGADVNFIGGRPVLTRTVEIIPVQDLFILEKSIVPLFRLELGATAIASTNFKVRVSGGVNFPGTQVFSIQGIYLMPQ